MKWLSTSSPVTQAGCITALLLAGLAMWGDPKTTTGDRRLTATASIRPAHVNRPASPRPTPEQSVVPVKQSTKSVAKIDSIVRTPISQNLGSYGRIKTALAPSATQSAPPIPTTSGSSGGKDPYDPFAATPPNISDRMLETICKQLDEAYVEFDAHDRSIVGRPLSPSHFAKTIPKYLANADWPAHLGWMERQDVREAIAILWYKRYTDRNGFGTR
jgi:hypothetical protein